MPCCHEQCECVGIGVLLFIFQVLARRQNHLPLRGSGYWLLASMLATFATVGWNTVPPSSRCQHLVVCCPPQRASTPHSLLEPSQYLLLQASASHLQDTCVTG